MAGGSGNVFTIHPAAPFLQTLAEALLDGRLVPGRSYRHDPLALADVTLFLPTQRAVAAMGQALRAAFGTGAVVLPRLRAISDAGEALGSDRLSAPLALTLPPVMSTADRQLALVRLIRSWRDLVSADRHLSPSGQPLKVPGSTADAFRLAEDLIAIIDQAALDGVDWRKLGTLVPDDYAAWWQMSLTFLEIATATLPALMAERGRIGAGDFDARMIEAVAAAIGAPTRRGPVIIAGSTGSISSTRKLMAAVLRTNDGAVVLPGLDLHSPDDLFAGFAGSAGHYQHTMARLIDHLGIDRRDVVELATPDPAGAARLDLIARALMPAETTDLWSRQPTGDVAQALAGVRYAVAANEAEEALVAAIALREALETPDARAMLVTPDRTTARRVQAELARFGIEAEDTAGLPLSQSPYGMLARLVAEIVDEGFAPVKLASLFGHPEARFAMDPARVRSAGRLIELKVLRGPRLSGTAEALQRAVAAMPDSDGKADAVLLVDRLIAALAPLVALSGAGSAPLSAFIAAEGAALAAITAAEGEKRTSRAEDVYARTMADYLASADGDLPLSGGDWPATLKAIIGNVLVRTPSRRSRVTITGPLEARLIRADRLVLAGLNEGTWPQATDTGPWLSRPMRAGLGMQAPEVRTGLAAHDFVEAMGTPDIVLVRSARKDGAPTVASRFLQRLFGLIGPKESARLQHTGGDLLTWARRLDDRPPERLERRPEPKPPVAARPRQLNVTEIETLIRDPYAIYARRILGLKPLDDFGEQPDFGTRGTLLHAILAEFARVWQAEMDGAALAALITIGEAHFAKELADSPHVRAMWWPRFVTAAGFVIAEFERPRAPLARHAEIEGRIEIAAPAGPFILKGRADRIDVERDGRVTPIDFKTGRVPTAAQIARQFAPQLPLEGVIAEAGGFAQLGPRRVAGLVHVRLGGLAGANEVLGYDGYTDRKSGVHISLADTLVEARSRLASLIAAYDNAEQGYLSKARPFRQNDAGDYDHLARVQEWRIAAEDGEGEP